jgi:hypothetical protein
MNKDFESPAQTSRGSSLEPVPDDWTKHTVCDLRDEAVVTDADGDSFGIGRPFHCQILAALLVFAWQPTRLT